MIDLRERLACLLDKAYGILPDNIDWADAIMHEVAEDRAASVKDCGPLHIREDGSQWYEARAVQNYYIEQVARAAQAEQSRAALVEALEGIMPFADDATKTAWDRAVAALAGVKP